MRADRLDRILTALEEGGGSYADGSTVRLICLVGAVREQVTKANARMAVVQLEDLYGAIEGVAFARLLAQQDGLLQPGRVLLVQGRIDVRDDKPPQLLLERVSPVPEHPPAPAASQSPAAPNAPAAAPAKPPHTLFLRLPTDTGEVYRHAERLLRVFEGPCPVVIRFADSGRLVRAPQALWVDPQAILLAELRRLLGEENVVLR